MKKIWILCLILSAATAFAQSNKRAMPALSMPTARANGMGGSHVAYTDNVFALLINPAAIMRTEQRSFFALSPTLLSPQSTFGLIKPIQDAVLNEDLDALTDAADILNKRGDGKIPLGFGLQEFPLSIAWVADGIGFGLWNRVFVNPNIIGTTIDINVYADVMLPIGFAVKVLETEAHKVDAGLSVKPFLRAIVREKMNLTEIMDDFDFEDEFEAPVLAGVGFDLGFMYRWDKGLRAGLTFSDIATRGKVVYSALGNDTSTYYIPFSVNLGAAYEFKIRNFWEDAPNFLAETGFAFLFDWHNIMNVFHQNDYLNHRNAALDISAGIQFSLFDMFMLRCGMNEMLPAVGLGLDLGPVELDLAYYGMELGLEPGQLSTAAVDLTLAIRPGAKKRNWPWARKSIVGAITQSDNL